MGAEICAGYCSDDREGTIRGDVANDWRFVLDAVACGCWRSGNRAAEVCKHG